MNKKILLSVTLGTFLFSGCSMLGTNTEENISVNKKNSLYLNDEFVPHSKFSSEDEIFKNKNKHINTRASIELDDILITKDNLDVPRNLISKKIDNINFKSKKLGNAINLLLTGINNVSLMTGPNVDLNLPVTVKINNKNLFETLQRVCYSVGYYLTYDKDKETIYIATEQTRNYRIPSGILIVKKASNELTGGATIELEPEDPVVVLEEGLRKAIGSSGKGVFIDRASGLIMIKEHPIYIADIDDYILNFVRDRSRQFMLEAAIVEIDHKSSKALGVDISNLSTVIGDLPVFVNSLSGGTGGFTSSVITSSYSGSSVSLDSVISAINSKSVTNVVDRPRVVVFNHSVGFVNRGSQKSYISGEEVVQGIAGNPDRTISKSSTYEDGLKLAMRVDAMPNSDQITLSLAPSIKNGELVNSSAGNSSVQNLLLQTRELMTNVNLKNGDIIVLGGIKSTTNTKTNETSPWFDGIPILGDIFQNNRDDKTRIETLFLVKVSEIGQTTDTYEDSNLESFTLLNDN